MTSDLCLLDVRSQSEAHPEPQQVTGKAPSDSQSSETGPNLGNGSHASNAAAQSASANTASHKVIGGRRLAIRKIEAQPTSLEDAKGSFDPLGPLGGAETPSQLADPPSNLSTDNPSTPPGQLQQSPISQQRSEASIATRDLVQRHDSSDSTQARGFAQSGASGTPRQVRPDHPINPPAKPSFEISVGDPHKVGDLATSHIVYQVRTKVCLLNAFFPMSSFTDWLKDFIHGLSTAGFCCVSPISRFSLAIQLPSQ